MTDFVEKVKSGILIFIFIMVVISGIFIAKDIIEDSKAKEACEQLPQCEKYKCLSDNQFGAIWDVNKNLLKYQNCLLEAKQ